MNFLETTIFITTLKEQISVNITNFIFKISALCDENFCLL